MTYSATINPSTKSSFDIFSNVKTFEYIPTKTTPQDKHAYLIVSKDGDVLTNAKSEHTVGHLLHWADKQAELYSSPEVKNYVNYLNSHGKKTASIVEYGILNGHWHPLAAVVTGRGLKEAVPFIDTDFYLKQSKAAQKHGVSQEVEMLYTILHEVSHTIRSVENRVYHAIYRNYPFGAEKFVERNVFEYAMKRAKEAKTSEEKEKWMQIAEIAKERYGKVNKIYSKRNSGKHKENIEEKVEDNENSTKKESTKEKNNEKESKENNTEESNSDLEARVENSENSEAAQEGEACEGEGSAEGGE